MILLVVTPPDDCAINFKYFNDQALNRKNPQKMEANLNMNKNNIINLKDPLPSNSQYAASVNFVNKSISDSNANLRSSTVKSQKQKNLILKAQLKIMLFFLSWTMTLLKKMTMTSPK